MIDKEIDKKTFRETEKKIYNYFRKDKVISSLKHKAEILNKQVDQIEEKLRNTDIIIPEESKAMTYEERVQTLRRKYGTLKLIM